jgi:hypothetical protein
MNFSRLAVAALTAWAAFLLIGSVVHGVLLTDLSARQASGVRDDPMSSWVGFGMALIGFFAFAYTYAKGYEGGSGMHEGMRFGVLVALMLVTLAAVWGYIVFPISRGLAAALAIDYVVEFAIYGMIVGSIYRPRRPAR